MEGSPQKDTRKASTNGTIRIDDVLVYEFGVKKTEYHGTGITCATPVTPLFLTVEVVSESSGEIYHQHKIKDNWKRKSDK